MELRPAQLPSGGWMEIPLVVLHGANVGPTVWLSAAIHGDEVGGVEIIRQVLAALDPTELSGTVLAVPIVNVAGFSTGDRYMPDRRDLNRSFPGSHRGSLASRFAHTFMTEIVHQSDVGIDLHTGSDHRHNVPQIRADLEDPLTRELTDAFGAPFALHARLRDGSLREAGCRAGATVLLYEGGEAWRLPRIDRRGGARCATCAHPPGCHRDACPARGRCRRVCSASRRGSAVRRAVWPGSTSSSGEFVVARQTVGLVADAIGSRERVIRASRAGVIIGRNDPRWSIEATRWSTSGCP